jgi:hypothetical protein
MLLCLLLLQAIINKLTDTGLRVSLAATAVNNSNPLASCPVLLSLGQLLRGACSRMTLGGKDADRMGELRSSPLPH